MDSAMLFPDPVLKGHGFSHADRERGCPTFDALFLRG
jgi:hypothetical protein